MHIIKSYYLSIMFVIVFLIYIYILKSVTVERVNEQPSELHLFGN